MSKGNSNNLDVYYSFTKIEEALNALKADPDITSSKLEVVAGKIKPNTDTEIVSKFVSLCGTEHLELLVDLSYRLEGYVPENLELIVKDAVTNLEHEFVKGNMKFNLDSSSYVSTFIELVLKMGIRGIYKQNIEKSMVSYLVNHSANPEISQSQTYKTVASYVISASDKFSHHSEELVSIIEKIKVEDVATLIEIIRIAGTSINPKVFEALLAQQTKINEIVNGGTLLTLATNRGYSPELLELLIKYNADLNIPNSKGHTPLLIAAKDHTKAVELFIRNGAQINDSYELLEIAAQYNNPTLVKLLLENKGNNFDKGLDNIAQKALSHKNFEILNLLLQNGAHISSAELKNANLTSNDISALLDGMTNKQAINQIIPVVYDNPSNFNILSKIIMSNSIEPNTDVQRVKFEDTYKTVIFNNYTYDNSYYSNDKYKKGEFLKFNDVDVGYNIHLPEGDIKAIVVDIYGGGILYKPGELSQLYEYLLSKNVVYISLNMSDLHKLKGFQNLMSEELHEEIHASIHHFYDVIHNRPEELHPDLEYLKGKTIFLQGTSFGGKNVERHAEKYPDTFNGYISFNGSLSTSADVQSDRMDQYINKSSDEEVRTINQKIRTEEKNSLKYLDPQHLETSDNASHLIIQCLNDNRVNAFVALDYYSNTKKAGKNLQVLFLKQGGNHLFQNKWVGYDTLTGHSVPYDKKNFEIMADKILSFIQGETEPEFVTDARIHEAKLYLDLNYLGATLQEKFISAAYRVYKTENGAIAIIDKFKNNKAEQDKAWEEYYKPLYLNMAYLKVLEQDIELFNKAIKYSSYLTNEAIAKAVESSFADFVEFLSIKYYPSVIGPLTFADIEDKSFFIDQFRNLIQHPAVEATTKLYLLKNIYLANPEIINSEEFISFRNSSEILNQLETSKLALINELTKEYEDTLSVWAKHIVPTLNPEIFNSQKSFVEGNNTPETEQPNVEYTHNSYSLADFWHDVIDSLYLMGNAMGHGDNL